MLFSGVIKCLLSRWRRLDTCAGQPPPGTWTRTQHERHRVESFVVPRRRQRGRARAPDLAPAHRVLDDPRVVALDALGVWAPLGDYRPGVLVAREEQLRRARGQPPRPGDDEEAGVGERGEDQADDDDRFVPVTYRKIISIHDLYTISKP